MKPIFASVRVVCLEPFSIAFSFSFQSLVSGRFEAIHRSSNRKCVHLQMKEDGLFFCHESDEDSLDSSSSDCSFGLVESDLGLIGPQNELIKALGKKAASTGTAQQPSTPGSDSGPGPDDLDGPKTRGAKRKQAESQAGTASATAKRTKGYRSQFSIE